MTCGTTKCDKLNHANAAQWAVNNSHMPFPQPLILTLAQFQDVLFTAIGMLSMRQTVFRARRFYFAASSFVSSDGHRFPQATC
jgi:hypothetical protein